MKSKTAQFFDDYFNLGKMVKEKQEYKDMMARVHALPDDYQYVFKKIQDYMWRFTAGSGYDMVEIQRGLVDLFEDGVRENRPVLAITGEDVADFADELLKSARTYPEDWKDKLNREIHRKVEGKPV